MLRPGSIDLLGHLAKLRQIRAVGQNEDTPEFSKKTLLMWINSRSTNTWKAVKKVQNYAYRQYSRVTA